jgi:hypothetical protein
MQEELGSLSTAKSDTLSLPRFHGLLAFKPQHLLS